MGSNAPFVHELLRYLQEVGFDGAPRLLGVDERGREVLSFVEGEVPHDHGGYRPSEVRLTRVAALIRRFHDITAGSALTADAEIVAHNELGPHNTVFAGDEPVAFIDWDDAAPGTRLFDLANAIWCFVDVGEGGVPSENRRVSSGSCATPTVGMIPTRSSTRSAPTYAGRAPTTSGQDVGRRGQFSWRW